MKLAIQNIANDKTIKSDTVQDLKEFNNQSLATQAKKEQLVSMMPAVKKAFSLMGDDIVERSTGNDALKNKKGSYDQQWLEESKANLSKQIDDENGANLIMSQMKKQMKKQFQIAHISSNKEWESEFDNIVSKKDKVQDLDINQLKLEAHDTYEKDEKMTSDLNLLITQML